MKILLIDLVVIFKIGVLHRQPKCASNGGIFVVLLLDIRKR